jgi:hypothetical protein
MTAVITPCFGLMSKYPPSDISDASTQDLYEYLQSKPINDAVNRGTYCP